MSTQHHPSTTGTSDHESRPRPRATGRHVAVVALTWLALLLTSSTAGAALPGEVARTPQALAATAAERSAGPVMKPGDRGPQVRHLQSRLHQLRLHSEVITGRYDHQTRAGVRQFQRTLGLRAYGVVTRRTWQELKQRTERPTRDALNNVYQPGRTLIGPGDTGIAVRRIQARLKQIGWFSGTVVATYDARTVAAVKGFQRKRGIPVTGAVDRRTRDRLQAMTRKPTKAELFNIVPPGPRLDPRCLTGRTLCIDKSSRSLRWVVDGRVVSRYDVRFGSSELPTREGQFAVFAKSRNHVSSLYHTPMPFAMFFSGGQAVHYSPDFAATGYNGASHGCVNVRDYDGIRWLYDQVRIGDKVVVYWS